MTEEERSKKGKYSKDKGKRGERAFCLLCKEHGFDKVRRTAQFRGNTGDAGDCEGLKGIHIEVKNVERLNLRDAMEQSIRDCKAQGKGNLPIVAHKKNNSDWLITMPADAWFNLYREYESGMF